MKVAITAMLVRGLMTIARGGCAFRTSSWCLLRCEACVRECVRALLAWRGRHGVLVNEEVRYVSCARAGAAADVRR
eukprot:2977424-Pleurochrysis_carterae.AAC.1